MPTILVLYPPYGTTSCGKVAQYAGQIDGLKPSLATENPISSYDEDIFNEVIEIPPLEDLAGTYKMTRRWCERRRRDGISMRSERDLLLGPPGPRIRPKGASGTTCAPVLEQILTAGCAVGSWHRESAFCHG